MKGSLIIVGFFVLGTLCGVFHLIPIDIVVDSKVSFYALCALMFSVGLSVGNDPQTLKNFRSLNPRLIFLPIMTILGTLAGSAAVSLILTHRSLTDCLAVGSGFGYYSLSSIFITEYKGAELGTIALLANFRELVFCSTSGYCIRVYGNPLDKDRFSLKTGIPRFHPEKLVFLSQDSHRNAHRRGESVVSKRWLHS